MKVKCEKCKAKFEFDDMYGLCPKCNYYNSPTNSSPDLDFVDMNKYDSGDTSTTDTSTSSELFEGYVPPTEESLNESKTAIKKKIEDFIKYTALIYVVFILFGGLFPVVIDLIHQKKAIDSLTNPSTNAPTYSPPPSYYVYEEEEIYNEEEIDKEIIEEEVFDFDFGNEEEFVACELPMNLITDGGNTVIGYQTTPNIVCTEAIIPEGITEIGDYAFKGCDDLEVLVLSSTVEKIGKYAFADLPNLKYLYLFSENLKIIDDYAFFGVNAREVYLPPNVEYIGDYAMHSMIIGEVLPTQTKLGINAISFGYSTSDDMQIQNGVLVRYTGDDKNIVIPEGVTMINQFAFGNNVLDSVVIPEGVTYIGENAFWGSNLTTIDFPSSMRIIDDSAFASNKNLNSINLNEGLIKIGHEAFGFCDNLTNVKIPSSVTQMSYESFYATIWEDNAKPEDKNDWIINDILLQTYAKDDGILVIPDNVKHIGSHSINCYYKQPKEIVFPVGIESIQEYAIKLGDQIPIILDIPETVQDIDQSLIPFSDLSFEMIEFKCKENSYAHNYAIRNDIHASLY